MLSGGAESSILLWDLERADNTLKRCTHRPADALRKYRPSPLFHKGKVPAESASSGLLPLLRTDSASHPYPFILSTPKPSSLPRMTTLSKSMPQRL